MVNDKGNNSYHPLDGAPQGFKFAVRYAKGEEKVCVLDRKPWLAKMLVKLLPTVKNKSTNKPL